MITLPSLVVLLIVIVCGQYENNNNNNNSHLWVSGFVIGNRYCSSTTLSPRAKDITAAGSSCTRIISTATTTTSSRRHVSADDSFLELSSALARLEKEQQKSSSKSRWSKLILPAVAEEGEYELDGRNSDPYSATGGATADAATSFANSAAAVAAAYVAPSSNDEYVWMLEPPIGRSPSCIVLFTGGAGLGQFPNIAYHELLSRVSDKLNALILAAPYSVGLDHFQLSKQTGELLRRALVYCQDDRDRPYMSADRSLPTYSLAHSLGCKLQTIYMLATKQDYLDGMGFMAYNNFSFAKTLKMTRAFTEELRKTSTRASRRDDVTTGTMPFGGSGGSESVINGIFDFAEMVAGAVGVDFSPNAADTERLIQLRYNDLLQGKTRVFVFDDDNLDSSREFVQACNDGDSGRMDQPKVSGLPGGHLSPVFFQWTVDDVMMASASGFDGGTDTRSSSSSSSTIPPEAMGGFQGASFGDETSLTVLVDEICDWILGKDPKRGPKWSQQQSQSPQSVPRISDGR